MAYSPNFYKMQAQDPNEPDIVKVDLVKKEVDSQIRVLEFQDKDTMQYIAAVFSLGVSGYGDTREKAIEMLKFSLDELWRHLFTLSRMEVTQELVKLGWKTSILKKREFSHAYVDADGELKGFNVVENSIREHAMVVH